MIFNQVCRWSILPHSELFVCRAESKSSKKEAVLWILCGKENLVQEAPDMVDLLCCQVVDSL